MKKIYKFLGLALAFFTGIGAATAQPVSRWEIADNYVTEITPDATVVIKEASLSADFGNDQYLSPTTTKVSVDETCIYKFIEAGTVDIPNVGSTPAYNLWNVSLKQYVSNDGNYTRSQKEAFTFTASLSVFKTAPSSWGEVEQDFWYNSTMKKDGNEHLEGNTFVFAGTVPASGGVPRYISETFGHSGYTLINGYYNTNAWYVFPVTEVPLTSEEKLSAAMESCFPGGTEGVFDVGTEIGTYSQAAVDRATKAYEAAFTADTETLTDEEIDKITDELYAAKKALDESLVRPTPGYYFINGHRTTLDAVSVFSNKLGCYGNYTVPAADTLDLEDLRCIWKLDSVPGQPGSFTMMNMAEKTFVGVQGTNSTAFPMVAAGNAAQMSFPFAGSRRFFMQDQNGNMCHVDAGLWVVRWQSTGEQNQYNFVPVPAEALTELIEQQEHALLVDSINAIITEGESALKGLDVSFDGNYNSTKKGLVTTATGNANDSAEGTIANLFDGNAGTFYSTSWHDLALDNDYDWLQMDFGHEIQTVYMKLTRRHNNGLNDPTKFRITKQGEDPTETIWSNILAEDTIVYTYHTDGITVKPIGTTNPNAVAGDSATAVIKLDLKEPAQVVRFSVMKTISNDMKNGARDLGPLWNLSELRFYEDLNNNPRYKLIPEALRNALQDAIDNAKLAIEDNNVTRAEYKAIEEALDAFWAAYPDPSELNDLVANAKALLEAAQEGEELGYFQNGAKAGLDAAIKKIEAAMGDKVLTLEEIQTLTAAIKKDIADFHNKLNKPEDGKFYRIVSASTNESNKDGYLYLNNADTNQAIKHGYKEDENKETRLNAIWQCLKNEDGTFALRNVATGLYFGNLYKDKTVDEVAMSSQLKPAAKADAINLIAGPTAGSFNIQLTDNRYANAQPGGGVLVVWSDNSANSLFDFVEADPNEFFFNNTVDIQAGNIQIVTQPYAISAEGTAPHPYKVLGAKTEEDGTYLHFVPWEGIIPAGTPFVVKAGEEENVAQLFLSELDIETFLGDPETFVYTNVEDNGLVGCIAETTIPAGLGIFIDDKVMISEEGDIVAAGSGYFKEVPTTEDEGEFKVLLEGVINGIGNITDNSNSNAPAAIYTISGVKVSEKAKNLPKGIYIVNGKKVIVK